MENFESFDLQKHIEKAREIVELPSKKEKRRRIEQEPKFLPEEEKPIFRIQIEKQRIMNALKQELLLIERGKILLFDKHKPRVSFDPETKRLTLRTKEGDRPILPQELLEDAVKGNLYSLDAAIPRQWRRRYVIEIAKQKISNLYEEQKTLIKKTSLAQKLTPKKLAQVLQDLKALKLEQFSEAARKILENMPGLIKDEPNLRRKREAQGAPHLWVYREFVKLLLEMPEKEQETLKKRLLNMLPEGERYRLQMLESQISKQRIMETLTEDLQAIAQNQEIAPAPESRPIAWDEKNRIFIFRNVQGKKFSATLGALIADLGRGVLWHLPVNSPKNLRKRYAIEKARIAVAELYDRQLSRTKLEKIHISPYKRKRYAYGKYLEKNTPVYKGFIVERMMIDLLKELSIDHPEFGVELEEATIQEDLKWKIDFFIKIKRRERAASIEQGEIPDGLPFNTVRVVGIQFTVMKKGGGKETHISQIRERFLRGEFPYHKVDDILLVRIPVTAKEVLQKNQLWKESGKPPGGPNTFWDINTRIEFLKTLTKGMGIDDLLKENRNELVRYYQSRIPEIPESTKK